MSTSSLRNGQGSHVTHVSMPPLASSPIYHMFPITLQTQSSSHYSSPPINIHIMSQSSLNFSNLYYSLSQVIQNFYVPQIHEFNLLPMLTNAKTGHSKHMAILTHLEPKTFKQVLSQLKWLQAMKLEYEALLANQTWTLTTLPTHREPVGCTRVFKVKENPYGTVNKYKACLVAKEYYQQFGFDYNENLYPVVKLVSIRVMFNLALTHK